MKTEIEIKEAAEQYANYPKRSNGNDIYNDHDIAERKEEAFIAGAQFAAPKWIPVEEALPEKINGKMWPILALNGKHRIVAYYFPEHFKTVEWEDYNQEDYPYTEKDNEKGVVWIRPGFYHVVECDRCDGYWSAPIPVTHWMPLPEPPTNDQKIEL